MEQTIIDLTNLFAIVFVPLAKPVVQGLVKWLKGGLYLITKDERIHDFVLPFFAILVGVGLFALVASMYTLSLSQIVILGVMTGIYSSGMYKLERE
jgi:hypothetical protein